MFNNERGERERKRSKEKLADAVETWSTVFEFLQSLLLYKKPQNNNCGKL